MPLATTLISTKSCVAADAAARPIRSFRKLCQAFRFEQSEERTSLTNSPKA